MALGLAFVYVPLLVVLISSFNTDRTFGWPPSGFTLEWWQRAWHNEGARQALVTSVKAGLGATAIALVLGSMAAFAVARYRFFGREVVSLLVVLPIALPGIVTGIALSTTRSHVAGAAGCRVRPLHRHRGPCHVLRRPGLQQRARPAAAHRRLAGGGVDGPRRRHLHDLPARDLPRDPVGPRRGRPARLRALLRRDHRHDLHRRRERADPAAVDLQQPGPAQPGADRQRGRRGPDPAVGLAGLAVQRISSDAAGGRL